MNFHWLNLARKEIVFLLGSSIDFPGGSDSKASAYSVGDPGSVPGSRKISWRRERPTIPVFLPPPSPPKKGLKEIFEVPLVAQRLKPLPAMQETWVRSLGQEDPLEKKMATYFIILAWRVPWMEEPNGL